MLIKIDHICYACSLNEEQDVLKKYSDYNLKFTEKNLKNIDIKKKILSCKNEHHNINYLESTNALPIEITSYQNICEEQNSLFYDDKKLLLRILSNNVQLTKELFALCGAKFQQECDDYAIGTIKGIFDKKALNIEIRHSSEKREWILDGEGVCCVAIVVKDINEERKKWLRNFDATEIDELEVNGRKLKIFFGMGKCGEKIEIISL